MNVVVVCFSRGFVLVWLLWASICVLAIVGLGFVGCMMDGFGFDTCFVWVGLVECLWVGVVPSSCAFGCA